MLMKGLFAEALIRVRLINAGVTLNKGYTVMFRQLADVKMCKKYMENY